MRIVMMGTGPFAVPTFERLVQSTHEVAGLVTRPVPPASGKRRSPTNPMRDAATAMDVPVWAPDSINDQDSVSQLSEYQADLLVVCDYGQILSDDALSCGKLGGINLHGSLLPKYRGAAPINWALFHGELITGVTVIHMTRGLDAGPILTTRSTDIDESDDAVTLEVRLSQLGTDAVIDAIAQLENWDGESPMGELQDLQQVTRAPRLKKQDGRIDWQRSALEIRNQIRAFKPWPGSYTVGGPKSQRWIIDEVDVLDEVAEAAAGTVIQAAKDDFWVATGSGVLAIRKIQPAGKRVLAAGEFLRGSRLEVGDRLGQK